MAIRFRLYLPDGVAAADTEGVEGETAADAAGGGRGGGRSFGVPDQADVDKVTWLHAYKYYTAMEYANFNPAEKAWIHQNRTEEKDKSPKRKVAAVRRGDDTAIDKTDDEKSLFGDDDESVSSKKSNARNPALARQGKKLKN
jgi:hypothetical protein